MECPFINENHGECSMVLNMQHIEDAFALCIDHYHRCPVYKHLRKKQMENSYVRSVEVIDTDQIALRKHLG